MPQSMKVLCILFCLTLKSSAMYGEWETSILSLKTRIDMLEKKEEVHKKLVGILTEAVHEIQDERTRLMQNINDLKITVKEQGKIIEGLEKQKHAVICSNNQTETKGDKMETNSTMTSIHKVKRSQDSYLPILDTAANLVSSRQATTGSNSMVAFHATIDSHNNWPHAVSHLTIGQAIVFDSVKLNAGGGYHSSTGLFLAPRAGMYLFSASVMTNGEIQLNIAKNGEPLAGLFASSRQQGSVTIAAQLEVGDEVLVKVQSPNDAYIWGDRLTSFTGCLISTA